ncbi:MAG: hypothetical protein U5L76_02220 [Patescibacteria group bacterium]|nr:hypothetical protein [Patescibacteria group bacterium]
MKKIILPLVILIISLAGCTNSQSNVNSGPKISETKTTSQYNWSQMDKGPYHDKISLATSSNLIDWQDQGEILVEHASVPDAIYKEDKIYLYFVDVAQDGLPEQTGVLISQDEGQNWTARQTVNYTGLGNKVPVDPSPVVLDDGRIRLYYLDMFSARGPEAIGTGYKNKIYSAISDDGINFTQEEGVRFEYEGVFDPSVIKVGNSFYMYCGDAQGEAVILATSNNGLDFNFYSQVYQGQAIPEVIKDGDTFYLYTGGIQIATSPDGFSFNKLNKSFQSSLYSLTADPSVISLSDNEYIMFYKTSQK